jgi:hypothetical protein
MHSTPFFTQVREKTQLEPSFAKCIGIFLLLHRELMLRASKAQKKLCRIRSCMANSLPMIHTTTKAATVSSIKTVVCERVDVEWMQCAVCRESTCVHYTSDANGYILFEKSTSWILRKCKHAERFKLHFKIHGMGGAIKAKHLFACN